MKMKKVLAIVLVLAMVFIFAACVNKGNNSSDTENSSTTTSDEKNGTTLSKTQNDVKDNNSTDESFGVNKSEWDTAVQPQEFKNVTFTYNATFASGYNDVGPHIGTYKLTENGMLMDGKLASTEEKTAVKTMFVDTAVAIVNNFNQFQYNEKNNNYASKESITYSTTILGYEATIIADDVLVVFNRDNNIAKISCKMTQEFKADKDNLTTYVLDVEFTFTDYGTTTLE